MGPFTKEILQSQTSFPDVSYPSNRDGGLQTAEQWLKGKVMDDGAEGLWRIHDKLYDFSDFMKNHPGGIDWLLWTKGTDITEAFETHHISKMPEKLLENYYIRTVTTKRHSPFTFKENGFYRTLKSRVRDELKDLPADYDYSSKRIIETLVFGLFGFAIAGCHAERIWVKALFFILSGLFMAWTIVSAHNFTHRKDNWRMHLFNFSFLPSREWRITHALSHHLFPNTLLDYEITSSEPIFLWLPRDTKTTFNRYGSWIYAVLIYCVVFDAYLLKIIIRAMSAKCMTSFRYEDFVPLSLPMVMYAFGNSNPMNILCNWAIIWHVASFCFNWIGLNAAHHHPDIFHDGDAPEEDRDWGMHQLHAVMDRVDINGSHFKVMTNFGEHGLHHLFPTLDHAILPSLHPVFAETCKEFGTQLKLTTQLELIIGQFRQMARTERKIKKI